MAELMDVLCECEEAFNKIDTYCGDFVGKLNTAQGLTESEKCKEAIGEVKGLLSNILRRSFFGKSPIECELSNSIIRLYKKDVSCTKQEKSE